MIKTFPQRAFSPRTAFGFCLLFASGIAYAAPQVLAPSLPPTSRAPATKVPAVKSSTPETYAGLNAVLWMRSAEYEAAVRQAYALATLQLPIAVRLRGRTAALEQSGHFGHLPPAIICDLDETMLDNSPYNARNVVNQTSYNVRTWQQWNRTGQVRPLPGAVAFAQYAARLGVRVFYISNRGHEEKTDTLRIIHRLGLPIRHRDDLMLKGEKPTWSSDKAVRRRVVAGHYRVLLLLGDDLNDFVSARDLTLAQRAALQQRYAAYWGTRWIVLPNPAYGSWEDAVLQRHGLTDTEKLQRKIQAATAHKP